MTADRSRPADAARPEISRRDPARPVPLTPAQERLWFLDRAGHGGSAYVHGTTFRIAGPLDRDALATALAVVVDRHEALRSAIVTVDGRPHQVVHPVSATLTLLDLDAGGHDAFAGEFLARPFDLARPPLLRAALLRADDEHHTLVLGLHHIVCDGASVSVLLDELFTAYRREPLPPTGIQFPDYARWLADLPGSRLAAERGYWRRQLAGAPAVSTIVADHSPGPRPATGRPGAQHRVRLDPALFARLAETARRERCTVFVAALAALAGTLSRYTGEDDVVVGAPADGRDRPQLERTVGMLVNTLALRVRLPGNPTLRDLLRSARASTLGGMTHAALPFDSVVDDLRIRPEFDHNPLFQVMLVVEPDGHRDMALAPGVTVRPGAAAAAPARFDLTVVLLAGESPELLVDYAADRYERPTVERFTGYLVRSLEALAGDPGRRLAGIELFTPAERAKFSGTVATGPVPDVVGQFRAQAAARPDAPALLGDGWRVSYGDLDHRSGVLAARLRTAGVGRETVVGVLATGDADAVVAVLGVLRAGGAYLPLDPAHPPSRVAGVLADARVSVVVAGDPAAPVLAGFNGTVVRPAPDGPAIATEHRQMPPDRLAYLIFTSGSTGRPKGVAVEHGPLARLTGSFVRRHGTGPDDRLLMVPPLTFDASVGDLFPALTSGAALVLHPEPARLSGAELVRFCHLHGVTAIDGPVVLLRRWVADFTETPPPADWPVRTVMVGGDRVPSHLVRAWAAATGGRTALVNHYGPTEATVCVTTYHTRDAAEVSAAYLPIGTPLPHVCAYVVDRWGGLAPYGATGELYLGGDCLARGYTDPALTTERFVPDPFRAGGGRMYRTGDLARWTSSGLLEFLGRRDRQVKVNGHRVEPGEVEAAVGEHPDVGDVAVLADGAVVGDGRERLVAFVVPVDGATVATAGPDGLRPFLRERLPAALVPAVVMVPAIPRTSHGKLDEAALRAALAARETEGPPTPETDRPRGTVESVLAELWAAELGVPRVGRTDNFFDLGGSSLQVAAVLDRVADRLGIRLPLRALFESDDLAGLARLLDGGTGGIDGAAGPDLRADAVLPPDILPAGAQGAHRPHGAHRVRPRPAGTADTADRAPTVLLTGATGFLGAHLLAELLARGARVICLVRADDANHAVDRVRRNLDRYALWPHGLDRVTGLPGDLGAPWLGLTPDGFDALAGKVHTICHNGGQVSFRLPYGRLRASNVDGTVAILRLADRAGAVPVHLVSTLGVYLGKAYRDRPVTEFDPPDDPTELLGGYNQSKWVGDALARAARDCGLPVSVHRPARIGADSRTGRSNPDDYFNRLVRSCVQLGLVPALQHGEDLYPVDRLAAAVAHLTVSGGARHRAGRPAPSADLHYFGRSMISYPELAAALVERGHAVDLVPWSRWRSAALDRDAAGQPLAVADLLDVLPEDVPDLRRPVFDCTATRSALALAGVHEPPTHRVLARQLDTLLRHEPGTHEPGTLTDDGDR